MGLFKRRSWSTYEIPPPPDPNPDPRVWTIMRSAQVGHVLVVEIKYPNCTNYEGRKVLLYDQASLDQLKAQHEIDPHFSDTSRYLSPFARFEPTERGWMTAIRTATLMACNKLT